jgi:hypothetical protein
MSEKNFFKKKKKRYALSKKYKEKAPKGKAVHRWLQAKFK